MTEMVYSTQRVANLGDRKIQNPIHFTGVVEGVKTVYVQEGYPAVNDAYEMVGVKVKPLSDLPGKAPAPVAAEKKDK